MTTSSMGSGSEFYDVRSTRQRYLAHRHSGLASPNVVMEEPAFLAAIGSVAGSRVADLGCGDGSTARTILALGARSYLGLDGSAGMIETARKDHDRADARFTHEAIEDATFAAGELDLVISRMALHYVEDLAPVFRMIQRALRPGGRFVFTVAHPVITSHDAGGDDPRTDWLVDHYFDRGPRTRPWFGSMVTWHHRTIEDYLDLLLSSGFTIDRLCECEPDAALLAEDPDELQRRRRVPLILLLAASRP